MPRLAMVVILFGCLLAIFILSGLLIWRLEKGS